MEEAKRMAQIAKVRELKAAGLEVKIQSRYRGMDYNKEVPFEHVVPEGKFKTGAEETPYVDPFKSNIALQQMEQRRRDDEEKSMRELDEKKMKKMKEKNLPKAINLLNQADNSDALAIDTTLRLKAP